MEEEQFSWVQEYDEEYFPSRRKRKHQSRKREFSGWGSRELIQFLKSIGRDTSSKVSQYDVAAIITKYINDNDLTVPGKKKRFQCDERLQSLFGKKTLGKNKIYACLGEHYAENNKDSDDDFLWSSDDKEDEDVLGRHERSSIKPPPKKKAVEAPKSPFAAILPDNIKLIYLKRSLVEELFKDPTNFEGKLVGSFIRIKSDPNDYMQKNPYRLLQVSGVKMASANKCADVLLKAFGSFKEIKVSMLSDDNFTEEECADLCQRVKDGLLQRLLIVEFEKKVKILHEDITKHDVWVEVMSISKWLQRELALLQNLIDRANEKGWRKELSEYLERRQLLQTPAEQSRLLQEVPKVIADEIEVTSMETDTPENDTVKDISPSPRSILRGSTNEIRADTGSNGEMMGDVVAKGPQLTPIHWKKHDDDYWHATEIRELQKTQVTKEMLNEQGPLTLEASETRKEKVEMKFQAPQVIAFVQNGRRPFMEKVDEINQQKLVTETQGLPVIDTMQNGQRPLMVEGKISNEEKVEMKVQAPQVIDLSSDDEIEHPSSEAQTCDYDIESAVWQYIDPRGAIQGPFSLESLKIWSDAGYFPPDFKVWKVGQNLYEAVLLMGILRQIDSK